MLQDVVTAPCSGKLKGRGCLLPNRVRHRRVSENAGLWRDQLMDFVSVVAFERGVSRERRAFEVGTGRMVERLQILRGLLDVWEALRQTQMKRLYS